VLQLERAGGEDPEDIDDAGQEAPRLVVVSGRAYVPAGAPLAACVTAPRRLVGGGEGVDAAPTMTKPLAVAGGGTRGAAG
jgi:hypothetical protein